MGWLDEALRRSDLDVGEATGVLTPAQPSSPWLLEQDDQDVASTTEAAPAAVPPAEGRTDPGKGAPPHQWDAIPPAILERLVVSNSAGPLLVEQFRSLAAALHGVRLEHPLKSIIVTSASPGDGKTHVAVNLALTLSDSYRRRVLLIDADLRQPLLHWIFGVSNSQGLSEALKATTDEPVRPVAITDTLTLLPAGRPDPSPHGGLSSDRMQRILGEAASTFDWVIVDTPPVGVLADGRLVAETVDGAILVVRAGVTQLPDLEAAADTIGRERILGIVLNAVDRTEIRGEDFYRHYSGGRTGREKALAG
jgi:capsular exopolysaccharide synthesis family protein